MANYDNSIYVTYTEPRADNVPRPPGPGDIVVNENLRCAWSNKSRGQCSSEVDFAVSFQAPPCGHDQAIGASVRLCGRHMLRAFFVFATTRDCEVCGARYRGIGLLKSLDRL